MNYLTDGERIEVIKLYSLHQPTSNKDISIYQDAEYKIVSYGKTKSLMIL